MVSHPDSGINPQSFSVKGLKLLVEAATRSTLWRFCQDIYLIAAALPWSTTTVIVFWGIWLIALIPTIEARPILRSLREPEVFLPVLLFALAAVGLLWSEADWSERLRGMDPFVKLLVMPLLFYHFERSRRGWWVFAAFFVSCLLLLMMSWIVAFFPDLSFKAHPTTDYYGVVARGVPVRNYIDQSYEFALCVLALIYPIYGLLRERRIWVAGLLIGVSIIFILNMTFVAVSRTALLTVPIILAVVAFKYWSWRGGAIVICGTAAIGIAAWLVSPQIRYKCETMIKDYRLYTEQNAPTSIGLRLEFWRKSMDRFVEAPWLGHGTGSIRATIDSKAGDQLPLSADVVRNLHNQTLNSAVQWGVAGIVTLYAMWFCHLVLFRGSGWISWIGTVVVVQNMASSMFNAHLSDFVEGWIYVLGVGVAGGMLKRQGKVESARSEALARSA